MLVIIQLNQSYNVISCVYFREMFHFQWKKYSDIKIESNIIDYIDYRNKKNKYSNNMLSNKIHKTGKESCIIQYNFL